jgi:D-alanyl-lipoteichoic acid acyltransferase DltB (MBOAT superfamily)
MISFAADYVAALSSDGSLPSADSEARKSRDARSHNATPSLPLADYSYVNYCWYLLYAPLYTAGPIATFDEMAPSMTLERPMQWRRVMLYALRWCAMIVTLEFVLSHVYVWAGRGLLFWPDDDKKMT